MAHYFLFSFLIPIFQIAPVWADSDKNSRIQIQSDNFIVEYFLDQCLGERLNYERLLTIVEDDWRPLSLVEIRNTTNGILPNHVRGEEFWLNDVQLRLVVGSGSRVASLWVRKVHENGGVVHFEPSNKNKSKLVIKKNAKSGEVLERHELYDDYHDCSLYISQANKLGSIEQLQYDIEETRIDGVKVGAAEDPVLPSLSYVYIWQVDNYGSFNLYPSANYGISEFGVVLSAHKIYPLHGDGEEE